MWIINYLADNYLVDNYLSPAVSKTPAEVLLGYFIGTGKTTSQSVAFLPFGMGYFTGKTTLQSVALSFGRGILYR